MIPEPDGAREWAERYQQAHNNLGEWKAAKSEAFNHLIDMVGNFDGIDGICTYKSMKGKPKVDWEKTANHIYAELKRKVERPGGPDSAPLYFYTEKFTTTPKADRRFYLKLEDGE